MSGTPSDSGSRDGRSGLGAPPLRAGSSGPVWMVVSRRGGCELRRPASGCGSAHGAQRTDRAAAHTVFGAGCRNAPIPPGHDGDRGFHEVGRPRIPRKHPRRGTPSYCAATSPIAGRTPAPFRNPANRRTNGPRNVAQHVNATMASLGDWDWRPVAASYAGPVLIVHGDDDWNPLAGSREWRRSFPNARLVVVPNAGHFIWLEQPEAFFGALDRFLGDGQLDGWSWPAHPRQ